MPSHLVRRYKGRKKRRRSEDRERARSNPPLFTDLVEFIGPGFAGFAASRFATRLAATQIAQRKPSWGKHAGGIAAVGTFLAAWLLGHKWKWLEKYHTPIVVGSAIASIQSLIQLYIPRLGWMVSDATPELAAAGAAAPQVAAATTSSSLPPGYAAVDEDPSLYVYDDRYDSAATGQPAQSTSADTSDDSLDLDDDDDLQMMGALA